ncbi:MAG: UDP-N-acetylmuramate--L-alanine ligase [Kiritimatiellia bacterium]|jgi:UDP-N-acetylmuramate--alanine ligase
MQAAYKEFEAKLTGVPGKAHFVGIGGVGMAGLALMMKKLGWDVTGCDAAESPQLPWLEANGIPVQRENAPGHLIKLDPATDIIIRTPAVPMSAPELLDASESGFAIFDRGAAFAAMTAAFETIAVCGTHGKTTTACFLAGILRSLAPDQTSWAIGGCSPLLGAVAGGPAVESGKPGGMLVAEADESDGTLRLYTPKITILTNIDADHMEHFHGVQDLEGAFREALGRTTGCVVYCADHPRARALGQERRATPAFSYGFSAEADYRLTQAKTHENGSTFNITAPEGATANVRISAPGMHNILNTAAAIVGACAAGFSFTEVCKTAAKAVVLPTRRFERIGTPAGFTVISDYSHHPVEIATLVQTARLLPHKRLLAVFQPHRHSRTRALLRSFPDAFRGVDTLVLCPVYGASERPLCGGESSDLYAVFREEAAQGVGIPIPVLAKSAETAVHYIRAILKPGDVVLVVGAGDINAIAPEIAETTPRATPPILLHLGAFGTDALATDFVAVHSVDALREAIRGRDFSVIGAGTNSFIAPTGAHRRLIHLSGPDFNTVKLLSESPESVLLEVGAALQGPALMRLCAEKGYSGIEYMAGIPGQCGGWLAMNAGTRRGTFCEAVQEVDVIAPDGTMHTIKAANLGATYRNTAAIRGKVAFRIRLMFRKAAPEDIRKAMDEALASRLDLSGIRTAGSVFKNPGQPLPPAGMLLDKAGCKGLRIGGACVTTQHANVIACEPDATASDVYALMHMMRERVIADSGIRLESEVQVVN